MEKIGEIKDRFTRDRSAENGVYHYGGTGGCSLSGGAGGCL